MTDKIRIAELTSEESRQVLTEEAVILLPMGSLEDQGTHAPMGDYLAAEAVAMDMARAARAEGVPTFVAPVIPFGGADHFGSTHGGIALSPAVLVAVLDDMFACLSRHGLKKLLIINGHGGNVPAITEVTLRWRQKTGMFVPSMYLWQIGYELLKDILGPEMVGAWRRPADLDGPASLSGNPAHGSEAAASDVGQNAWGGCIRVRRDQIRRRPYPSAAGSSGIRPTRGLGRRSRTVQRRDRQEAEQASGRDRCWADPRSRLKGLCRLRGGLK